MPRTLIALATYNEIENLPGLVDEILHWLPEADILVVDDNSPDGTGTWCDSKSPDEPRLKCVHRPAKQGLGSAAMVAFRQAIEQGYDVVATLDADWSHDPRYLPELVRATSSADVAIGSRYVPGGAIEGWPWYRRVLSRAVNRLSRGLLRLPVRDSSGAYRAYRVDKLRDVDLSRLQATGYAYLEEVLWALATSGATFAEVPITFHQRRGGVSKVSVREAVSKLAVLLRLSFRKGFRKGDMLLC